MTRFNLIKDMVSTTMETTTGNGELDSGGATSNNGDAAPVAVRSFMARSPAPLHFFYLWRLVSLWLKT